MNFTKVNLVNKKQKRSKAQKRLRTFTSWLLLKETLKTTWKSKLQLVILLLLSAFSTTLITGTWVSYTRIVEEAKKMGLEDHKFDAVMEYNKLDHNSEFSASWLFSLNHGVIRNKNTAAITYAFISLGKDTNPLSTADFIFESKRGKNNKIETFVLKKWKNEDLPLILNLDSINVKASLWGQLIRKYEMTQDETYKKTADFLYETFVKAIVAPKIIASLNTYIKEWIEQNKIDDKLNEPDETFFKALLAKKINYQDNNNNHENLIPEDFDVNAGNSEEVLKKALVYHKDPNPRATSLKVADKGINGNWIRITRLYKDIKNSETRGNLRNYNSSTDFKSNNNNLNYNKIGTRKKSTNEHNNSNVEIERIPEFMSSWYHNILISANAALQGYRADIVNQFSTTVGLDKKINKIIRAKVINIGTVNELNHLDLKIIAGRAPKSNNEIVLTPQYANSKNIKPGDFFTINEKQFLVAGIGGDPYHIYPTINAIDVIPNAESEFLVYVLPDAYSNKNLLYDTQHRTDVSLVHFVPIDKNKINQFNKKEFNRYYQPQLFKNDSKQQAEYFKYLSNRYSNFPIPQKFIPEETNRIITNDQNEFKIYNAGYNNFQILKTGFWYLSWGSVLLLLIIIIFITYFIVRKSIQKNQISMGILKANGYLTRQIVLSYLSYPLLIIVIAIPIGWITGLIAQLYFAQIFNSLFVLPYNIFNIKLTPLLLAIVVIGSFVAITALFTSHRMLQKNPLLLIRKDNDIEIGKTTTSWLERKLEKKFHLRFLISLSKTSWKKIAIITSVISVATLALTATISIPATVKNMKSIYFSKQNYKNIYNYVAPIPNHPLNKIAYYNWSGINNIKNQEYYPIHGLMPWMSHKIISSGDQKLGYLDPTALSGTTDIKEIMKYESNISPEMKTAFENDIKEMRENNPNLSISVNDLLEMFLWLSPTAFSVQWLFDMVAKDQTKDKVTDSLQKIAQDIIRKLLNINKNDNDNKDKDSSLDPITNILKELLPGFQQQILKSYSSDNQNPYKNFVFGLNNVAVDNSYSEILQGAVEELVTNYELYQENGSIMNLTGISPETKMLKIDNTIRQAMAYNENSDIIPTVITKPFAQENGLRYNSYFTGYPNIRTLYYKTRDGIYKPLPKANWKYQNNERDIWGISPNHWKYTPKPNKLGNYNFKYAYNFDGEYDKNGEKIMLQKPQPWNETNEVWLTLPDDIAPEAWSGTVTNKGKTYKFAAANIAKSSAEPNVISPFSHKVIKENADEEASNLIVSEPPDWYSMMTDRGVLTIRDSITPTNLPTSFAKMEKEWYPVILDSTNPAKQYKVVGIIDSYDTPIAYIDQKAANRIIGYDYKDQRTKQYQSPVYQNQQLHYFNGKYSAKDSLDDLITRSVYVYSNASYSLYGSALASNKVMPLVKSSDLLSRKQEMLNEIADISLRSSFLFIIITIICSILIIIMVTDLFTDQFRRFMALMKSEGYKNHEINHFTLGIFTPWVIIGYIIGFGLGYLALFSLIKIVTLWTRFSLPLTFIWWVLPLTFMIVTVIYISTFLINNYQLNKMNLIEIIKTND